MTDTVAPQTERATMIAGKPLRRRHLGTIPGDALLMPTGDSTAYTRLFHDFLQASELPPGLLNPSRLCMVPIPAHADREELRDHPVTNWANPLFWLPRQWRVNERGATDDLMGLRATWELTLGGLYDPTEGFVDVLYAHDIDVETPDGARRVQQWLDGSADDVLDTIDVTQLLSRPESEDEDWVQLLAFEALPGVLQTVWGLNAHSFLEMLTGAVEDYQTDQDAAAFTRALTALLSLGSAIFEDIVYDEMEASDALSALADHIESHPDQGIGTAIVFRDFLRFVAEVNEQAITEYMEEIQSEPEEVDVDAAQRAAATGDDVDDDSQDDSQGDLPDLPDTDTGNDDLPGLDDTPGNFEER